MRVLFGAIAIAVLACGQSDDNLPFPPHKIVGNVYYVGASDIAVYLITSKYGHVLINTGYETTPALIYNSVTKLGFKPEDINYLLNSQAHYDHIAGQSVMRDMTSGAQVWASMADTPVIEGGGKGDFLFEGRYSYPPVRVNKRLNDGDTLQVGDTTLVAHITPGHTKGCTTWTMKVKDGGKMYDVVIVGGTGVNPGTKLIENPKYPQIVVDYIHMFQVLRSLHCDIFLGAHGGYYGMKAKYERMKKGEQPNPFIDPEGYARFIDTSEKAFKQELARQQTERASK